MSRARSDFLLFSCLLKQSRAILPLNNLSKSIVRVKTNNIKNQCASFLIHVSNIERKVSLDTEVKILSLWIIQHGIFKRRHLMRATSITILTWDF